MEQMEKEGGMQQGDNYGSGVVYFIINISLCLEREQDCWVYRLNWLTDGGAKVNKEAVKTGG